LNQDVTGLLNICTHLRIEQVAWFSRLVWPHFPVSVISVII